MTYTIHKRETRIVAGCVLLTMDVTVMGCIESELALTSFHFTMLASLYLSACGTIISTKQPTHLYPSQNEPSKSVTLTLTDVHIGCAGHVHFLRSSGTHVSYPHEDEARYTPQSPTSRHPSPKYHPDFTDVPVGQDTVVTLVSRDGTRFRVSSTILKTASRFFATTLPRPQSPETCPKEAVIDDLDEDAPTIEGLLKMVTGKECPQLDTLEVIEPLLLAAAKWGMPGPSSIMKIFLRHNPSIVSEHPLRFYWLGCHLGWDGVTKLASKLSCNSHIYSPNSRPWLQRLASTDLIRLMEFHRNRRDMMMKYLEGGNLVSPDCPKRMTSLTLTHAYQVFQWQFLEQMESVPPGCRIGEDVLQDIFTSLQLETVECPKSLNYGCGARHWSTIAVLARIKAHWSTLPQTV